MTVEALLEQAREAGMAVYLDASGRLAVDVPDDASPEADAIVDALAARAAEVKAHLRASQAPPPSSHSAPASLVRQAAARLRAGRAVRLETAYGEVVLAPNLEAARWAEERYPGVPVFLPHEWRALLDCESPDEVNVLVAVKRHLGARLLPEAPAEKVMTR